MRRPDCRLITLQSADNSSFCRAEQADISRRAGQQPDNYYFLPREQEAEQEDPENDE